MNVNPELIEMIYDVPLGNSNWLDVLSCLQKEFNFYYGYMFIISPNKQPLLIKMTKSDESSVWTPYTDYYSEIDPWNLIYNDFNKFKGRIIRGTELMSQKDFLKTEYYNDWWKKIDFYYSGGGIFTTDNGITFQISLPRDKAAGEYTNEELIQCNYYVGHIKRAIELEGITGRSLPYPAYEFSLSSRFGLTSAEAKLALTLFKTTSLPEAAKTLNRSYHTVRNQMKTIYQKTETKNQLDLYKLLRQ